VHFSATTVFASIFSFEINPFLRSVNWHCSRICKTGTLSTPTCKNK
jgi:hypothetical protein